MNVYVVCWGFASSGDCGKPAVSTSVYGVYGSKRQAQDGLSSCMNNFYNEIVNHPDYTPVNNFGTSNLSVFGSVQDGYFKLSYVLAGTPYEIRIDLEEKEII